MKPPVFFDEMHSGGGVRAAYDRYAAWLHSVPQEVLQQRHDQANSLFRTVGITFNVYGEEGGVERLIPVITSYSIHYTKLYDDPTAS